jgi:tetratricopeptide (TPR) repeat protein
VFVTVVGCQLSVPSNQTHSSDVINSNQVIDSLIQLSNTNYKLKDTVKLPYDEYLKIAVEVALANNQSKRIAEIYNLIAKRHRNISEYSKAISFYQQSLAIIEEIQNDSLKAKTWHELAVVFRRIDYNAQALKLYMRVLEWAESNHDTLLMHSSLNGIGNVYISYNNYYDAIGYFQRSLAYQGKMKTNRLGMAINTNNIGEAYLFLHNTDSALVYLKRSFKINLEIGSELGQAICHNGIGMVYVEQKHYEKARYEYQKSLEINQKIGDLIYVADNHRNLGKVYMLTGNYPLSEEHLLKALEIGKTIGSNLQILEADKILSELYSYMQKTELALEHMRESMAYKDSITKEVSRQNSEAMDVLFRAEKQEREIVILKQKAQLDALQISRQKFLIIGIASFVLAIAVIILFFYRQRLLKEKLSQMSLEQKLLRTQLNPHFVFNSLAAVQNYILHNDKIAASDYLVNFSRLMRNILMGSGSDFIPLENELEILNDYLKLQQLRFQNKFDYRFEISNNIEPQTCMVPPMLVQPFVENSIEHGIRGIDRQGLIIIRFNREQNLLLIEVEDNGIGLQEHSSEKQKSNHVSMATKITKQRMQNLQSITKRTCKLEILDKITHKSLPGVLIRIQIPFNEGNG